MKALLTLLTLSLLGISGLARAAEPVKPYALDYCVYSHEKLGAMGKVLTENSQGQEMKFCCKACQKEFDQDPAAGLKKCQAAVASKSSGGGKMGH